MDRSKYSFLKRIFDVRFSVNEFLSYAEHYTEQIRKDSQRRYLQRVIDFVQQETEERWRDGKRLPVFNHNFLNYVLRGTTRRKARTN